MADLARLMFEAGIPLPHTYGEGSMVAPVSVNPGSAREGWSRPTARIDWLAGPIAERDGEGREALHTWLDQPRRCTPDAGFRGYNDWHGDRHGSKVTREVLTDRMGHTTVARTYVIIKGTGLMQMRANGYDDAAIARRFIEWRGVCKRIDLAVDVLHPEVTPEALYSLFRRDHFVTRFGTPQLVGVPAEGQTFYLRAKDQVFRAYDKTAERARKKQNLPKGVTRLEIELRGRWASCAFDDLQKLLASPSTWHESFPQFVCGVILQKVRPLDGKKPETNPQRAPIWTPLREAWNDVGPVRLSREEMERSAHQVLAGRASHLANMGKLIAFMRELIGEDELREFMQRQTLDPDDQLLAALLKDDPARLRAGLVEFGIQTAPAEQIEEHRASSN